MLNTMIEENLFYSRMIETTPQVISMFYSLIKGRSNEVISTDAFIISRLHKLDDIINELGKFSNPKVQYGNETRHYLTVGRSLLRTLKQGLDKQWSGKIKIAWLKCYATLSDTLLQATNYAPLSEVA